MDIAVRRSHLSDALPLLLGIAITLILRGYQFGGGNHTVYLIAPLREIDPTLLANDWWTTHTLQYHLAFTKISALFMRLNIIQPVFFIIYLGLVVLLHLAWFRIVKLLHLDARAYLLSVMLYYLSAGGTGLGTYQFLQDSSVLPGNIANIAMLWGLAFLLDSKLWPAAICMSLAAIFHLNHALIALLLWGLLPLFTPNRIPRLAAFFLIMLFALPNLVPALKLSLSQPGKMPLNEFVELYAKLRHPHHYDPVSWPVALWLSFLWPIPLAFLHLRNHPNRAVLQQISFFLILQLMALLFAGIFFISEPLIQMSLFRFSIYPKLLTCVLAAAWMIGAPKPRKLVVFCMIAILIAILAVITLRLLKPASTAGRFVGVNWVMLIVFLLVLALCVMWIQKRVRFALMPLLTSVLAVALLLALWHNWLGLTLPNDDRSDRDYLALCDWARDHTPVDALFIVPPNEQHFRFRARRAIIVNFKGVPQLSSEMREWRYRLENVLDMPLTKLPRRFDLIHSAMAARHDQFTPEHFQRISRQYGARYLVTTRPLPGHTALFENASTHLYDLAQPPK